MITEKVYGKLSQTQKKVEYVSIDWFEREKRLLRKTTDAGTEIGIKIDVPLNENDIIYEDDNRVIAVTIAPSELICVSVSSMQEMGQLCFELGNRHLPIRIGESDVKCPFDEPTFEYLKKLGYCASKICEKFTGYTECKGHTHTHTDAHKNNSPSHDHGKGSHHEP